jgi:hypothetical protein
MGSVASDNTLIFEEITKAVLNMQGLTFSGWLIHKRRML